jgi:hypothetical protein
LTTIFLSYYNKGTKEIEKVMKQTELEQWYRTYHKGAWVKATWKSEKIVNGVKCEKVSNGVIRFVDYENMRTTKIKRLQQQASGMVVAKRNNGKSIIKDLLIQANNGNLLVVAKTTHIKPKSTYKLNGMVVDKATYETMVKPTFNDSGTFTIKLENLLSIG